MNLARLLVRRIEGPDTARVMDLASTHFRIEWTATAPNLRNRDASQRTLSAYGRRAGSGLSPSRRAGAARGPFRLTLHYLAEGAHVAQPSRRPQADVRLVTLRLEVVDVAGLHDPASLPREVKQHLSVREGHDAPYLSHAVHPMGTGGRFREQTVDPGNRRSLWGTNAVSLASRRPRSLPRPPRPRSTQRERAGSRDSPERLATGAARRPSPRSGRCALLPTGRSCWHPS